MRFDLAKAFLCWDEFPHLSIKLIPIDEAVAFFYPPARDLVTINLFYERAARDFKKPLFLLFHETGHLIQWQNFSKRNEQDQFWRLIELDKGKHKIEFERAAWSNGERLIVKFIEKIKLDHSGIIEEYQKYGEQCLLTYQ